MNLCERRQRRADRQRQEWNDHHPSVEKWYHEEVEEELRRGNRWTVGILIVTAIAVAVAMIFWFGGIRP